MESLPRTSSSVADLLKLYDDSKFYVSVCMTIVFCCWKTKLTETSTLHSTPEFCQLPAIVILLLGEDQSTIVIPGLDVTEWPFQCKDRLFQMLWSTLGYIWWMLYWVAEITPIFWTVYLAEMTRVRGSHKGKQELLAPHPHWTLRHNATHFMAAATYQPTWILP